jgi:hypothetical protein
MIVELMMAASIGFQEPLPPAADPAQTPPPVSNPAPPTPPQPPLADVIPAAPPAPPQGATPSAVIAPRGQVRRAAPTPLAPSAPPVPGQHGPGRMATPTPPGTWHPPAQGAYSYGTPGAAVGSLSGAHFYTWGRTAPDPKEAELDRKTRELAGNFMKEQDPQKKGTLKTSLQQIVAEQFQIRQQRRIEDLKRLEDEVKRLRDAMDKREKSKDAIIAKRIAELTGDDDLGF